MKNYSRSLPAFFLYLGLTLITGCNADDKIKAIVQPDLQAALTKNTTTTPVIADAATILSRPEVPILCYHQLRDFKPTDSKTAKDYIVPVPSFQEQIKLLADGGYHSVLPDQLYEYLAFGKPLPEKPVMITFDDTRLEHFTVALPELKKYGFKGVFFIMTVSLNRPGYMTREQVKELSDEGNTVGLHTWNHQNVKILAGEDWSTQIEKPWDQLKQITGRPVDYFAYPFGLWNEAALEKIRAYGFKAAFQLSGRRDENSPLFSIRRIIIPGEWGSLTMKKHMLGSF